MKKLSKEKTQQLALVGLITVAALVGMVYLVIKPQHERWQNLKVQREAALARLQQVKQTIENADQIESQLCEAKKRLDKIEDTMATGDLYSWTINTIRQFKLSYKIDVPQFSQIDGPKEVSMLAKFPYKQASLTIGGSGQFHELGRFFADFENQFPYMRLLNLSLEPGSSLNSTDKERLSFKLEVVTLVKPGAS
jgi:Tfp pilus assembly protein PilO